MRGKPIEFRRYGPYAPHMGCRFDCDCGKVYFVTWERNWRYWDDTSIRSGDWKKDKFVDVFGQVRENKNKGRFAKETTFRGQTVCEQTGYYRIDLSYYASYNDEPMWEPAEQDRIHKGERKPLYLCEDNAEDAELSNESQVSEEE